MKVAMAYTNKGRSQAESVFLGGLHPDSASHDFSEPKHSRSGVRIAISKGVMIWSR